jgi:hypothetical protein
MPEYEVALIIETGRTTRVALSAYRDVRKALSDLFAGEDND